MDLRGTEQGGFRLRQEPSVVSCERTCRLPLVKPQTGQSIAEEPVVFPKRDELTHTPAPGRACVFSQRFSQEDISYIFPLLLLFHPYSGASEESEIITGKMRWDHERVMWRREKGPSHELSPVQAAGGGESVPGRGGAAASSRSLKFQLFHWKR